MARWGPWRTGCSCAGTSNGSSTTGRGPCRRCSLDGELAFHALRPVVADRAVEVVGAGLEVGGGGGLAALADGLALLLDAVALDLDGVRHVGRVVHRDRDLAGLRAQLRLVELQRAAGISGDRELLAASGGARGAARGAAVARGLLVVATTARKRERGDRRDQGEPTHGSPFVRTVAR